MKKNIAVIAFVIGLTINASSQNNSIKLTRIDIGISAGRSETTFYGSQVDDRTDHYYSPDAYFKERKGLIVTIHSKITFGNYLYVKPSLSYVEKGAEEINTRFLYNFKADLNYLSIPLLIGFQPINFENAKYVNIFFEGGIVPNFQLTRENDNLTKGYAWDPKLQEMIWSYQVGVGIEIKLIEKITLFGNYSYFKDLTPFFEFKESPHDLYAYNKGTTLSFGLMIMIKNNNQL